MTKSRTRRTGSGYKANVAWVTRPGTGMPDSHAERRMVNPTGPREEGASYLERSPALSVPKRTTVRVTVRDGVGEVSRGRSSPTGRRAESLVQGAVGPIR